MAKKPKVICPECKESFYREETEFVHIKNRYWHKTCYENKNKAASKEEQDLKLLGEYIQKLFQTEYVSPRVQKQIKKFKKEYDYSYSGILLTLKHFYEIKNGDLSKSNGGIGIVPYVYNDARDYYERLYTAENKNVDFSSLLAEKVIRIRRPKPRVSKVKTVDLSLLEKEVLDERS